MATAPRVSLLILVGVAVGAAIAGEPLDFGNSYYAEPDFIDLMTRDAETLPDPVAFGHKYISGGAGEGVQRLHPDGEFEARQQVKTDNVLPAYCEPRMGVEAGCIDEFENTAEFSRNYQAQQQCLCDHEHMFNCPSKAKSDAYGDDAEGAGDAAADSAAAAGALDEGDDEMNAMLAQHGLHKSVMSKKFHEKRSDMEIPRRKRSGGFGASQLRPNPYLNGEPLRSVAKKDGRKLF